MSHDFTDEQVALRRVIRELMDARVRDRAAEIDEREEFPDDVLELFRDNDVFAAAVPPDYGGLDGSLLTVCLIAEEIARVCATSGMLFGNQYLGAGPIALFGSEEQRIRYLPPLATGERLASFALTEPEAGSDVRGIRTRATPHGGGWTLTGRKVFITHANVADLLTVFAKTDDDALTAFLLDRSVSPWVVDKVEHKMGLRGSPTCSVVLDDVWVPADAVVGEVGWGMRIALASLNKGRIMTASLALGIAQGAIEAAIDYALAREQFGRPIAEFQAIQLKLAEMETETQAARALTHDAARAYDAGRDDAPRFSAMAKLFATEMVNRVTSQAVQVLGGYGYIRDYPVERMMRDARIFAIFEGTNEIQRLIIARQLLDRGTSTA